MTRDAEQNRARLPEQLGLAWDFAIILLVVANLCLIVFDSFFAWGFFSEAVAAVTPDFHAWYAGQVHSNFQQIDLWFVAIFLADVVISWIVAIARQRYHRWFFYPFVHWYDVLGCIPLAGFRWLRALRVIALLLRLQRLGWIDMRQWAVVKAGAKYYDILLEELSDRIVVKVLSGVQDEIRDGGSELPSRIANEVVVPRKAEIDRAIAGAVEDLIRGGYQEHRDTVQGAIQGIVQDSVARNSAARRLEKVPMVGSYMVSAIDDTIGDSVADVLDSALGEMDESQYQALVGYVTEQVLDGLSRSTHRRSGGMADAVNDIIDLVKEQVMKQRWKSRYQ